MSTIEAQVRPLGGASAAPGRGGRGLGAVALDHVPAAGLVVVRLGRGRPAVPAGPERRASAFDLPRRLGRGDGLLDPGHPMGPADRPDGLARLAGDGPGPLVLLAGLPRPGPAGRAPAGPAADDRGAGRLGGIGICAGLRRDGVPLVLPGAQPARRLAGDPGRRPDRVARGQLRDRRGQRLGRRRADPPPAPPDPPRRPAYARSDAPAAPSSPCVAATLGYGAYRLETARFRPGPRVALLQSSFVQRYKESKKLGRAGRRLLRMVIRAAARASAPT